MTRIAAVVLVALFSVASLAAEVAGIKLDDKTRIDAGGPDLVLNGAGIRTRFVVKVYVGGLYLTEKKTAAADAIAVGGPKRVSITMLRDVGAQQFNEALVDGFRANNTAADVEKLKAPLDELGAIMNALGEAKKGNVITLDFVPGTGTRVLVDGAAKGKPIAGDEFYKGLLRIWLGDKPVDGDLKKAMLGQG
ncbi:MAG TPA: chalcone isomerase family protein [Burkholderiales bacterium]|nr:chalcone isomerase family protein [Burkholderiales bacterium]